MGTVRHCRSIVALGALGTSVLVAGPACAGEASGSVQPRQIVSRSGSGALFDIRHIAPSVVGASAKADPDAISETAPDDPVDNEKIKLGWIYRPMDSGPQFQIGALGGRTGAVKKPLVHVAMDWAF